MRRETDVGAHNQYKLKAGAKSTLNLAFLILPTCRSGVTFNSVAGQSISTSGMITTGLWLRRVSDTKTIVIRNGCRFRFARKLEDGNGDDALHVLRGL